MSERPSFTVEYLEPVEIEAEPLPDEFSPSRLRRSLLAFAVVVLVVVAAVVLVPGLSSLRGSFMGAQPGWLVLAACSSSDRARPTCSCSAACSAGA